MRIRFPPLFTPHHKPQISRHSPPRLSSVKLRGSLYCAIVRRTLTCPPRLRKRSLHCLSLVSRFLFLFLFLSVWFSEKCGHGGASTGSRGGRYHTRSFSACAGLMVVGELGLMRRRVRRTRCEWRWEGWAWLWQTKKVKRGGRQLHWCNKEWANEKRQDRVWVFRKMCLLLLSIRATLRQ